MRNVRILGIDPSLSNFGLIKSELNLNAKELILLEMKTVSTDQETETTLKPVLDKKTNKMVLKKRTTRKKGISTNDDDLRRAQELSKGLMDFIADFKPDLIIAELPVGSQGSRPMASYGLSIGVISQLYEYPLIRVTPIQVKQAGSGSNDATKHEQIDNAVKWFPNACWEKDSKGKILMKNEHTADALFAIKAAFKKIEFKQFINDFINKQNSES